MAVLFYNPRAFAPFYSCPVAFHGSRPDERKVARTVACQVVEDAFAPPGDTAVPIRERVFDVSFPSGEWPAEMPPNVGDWVWFKWQTGPVWGKVEHVGHMPNGDYVLSVINDPKEKDYPAWSM